MRQKRPIDIAYDTPIMRDCGPKRYAEVSKETYHKAKETYHKAKETYHKAKETYQRPIMQKRPIIRQKRPTKDLSCATADRRGGPKI